MNQNYKLKYIKNKSEVSEKVQTCVHNNNSTIVPAHSEIQH